MSAATPPTAEERLAHLRNAVYVQQSNANVVLPTEDVKWLLDAARPATDPAGLDVERLAKALILAHSSEDGEPFGDEQESIESLYSRRTSWLDVPEEWYETPRQLAAWVAAQYKRLGEQREGN